MGASNDNNGSAPPAPRGDDGWRSTTVTLNPKEFFSDPANLDALFKDTPFDTPLLRLASRFRAELAGNDSPAFMMREARRYALRIHRTADAENIDLHGDKWIAPERFGDDAHNLTTLFNGLTVSGVYRAWQAERTDQLVSKLAAKPFFRMILNQWHRTAPCAQAAFAQWISKHHQSVFADDIAPARKVKIGIVNVPRRDERLTLGDHRAPEPGKLVHKIRLNMHADAELHQIAKALNVIFHENTHAVHDMLACALVNAQIDSAHPLYDDARLLLLATNERHGYITGIKSVYRAHPTEEDTFRASDAFVAKMTAALAPHGMNLEPREREVPRTPHYAIHGRRNMR